MLKLNFKNGEHDSVELSQPRVTIGRDSQNTIVLTQEGISGFHAEIHMDKGKLFIVDLGSTNGTFINGRKLQGREEVKTWDQVSFDKVVAEVVDTDQRRPTKVSRAVSDADLSGTAGKTQVRQAVGGFSLKGTSGDAAGKVFPLSGRQVIGQDSGCDIVIDDPMVSSRHAAIDVSGQKLNLTDLGSTNGTFVNGKRVKESSLSPGDEVRFDQVSFKVEGPIDGVRKTEVRPSVTSDMGPHGTRMEPAVANASLKGTGGKMAGKTFFLSSRRMTIGRTDDNDIVIDDDTVSSNHAAIFYGEGAWALEDTGSSNGTFVNNKKISRQEIKNGDRVRFGQVELEFDGPEEEKPSVTRTMSSVDPKKTTRTVVMPSLMKRLPAWIYGMIGFGVVGAILAGLYAMGMLGGGSTNLVDAKLQGARVWIVETGRQSPVTPLLADINDDYYLDVILADIDGIVLALDGAEGKRIFEADISGRVLAPLVAGDLTGDGVEDVIVAGSDGVVTALNGKGKVLWRSAGDLDLGEIINRPVLAKINEGNIVDVIVPTPGKGLVALDGERGWPIWDTSEMTKGNTVTSPIVADLNGDGVADFATVADSGQVMAFSSRQGRVWQLWEAQVPNVLYASPLFIRAGEQPLVVVATDGGGIVALNAENGRMAWIADIEKRFFASPVGTDASGNGITDVILVATNGDIHVLDGQTGDEIWSASLGAGIQASPALRDLNGDGLNDLLLLDKAGNLRVFGMARGREMTGMSVSADSGFIASPVMGDINNDGLLNVIAADQKGRIYAIGLNRPVTSGKALWPVFLGNDTHGM